MSDLFRGQTMTEAYKCISASTLHTFQFNFPPDKVVFNNLTQWVITHSKLPISVYFKGQTTSGRAYQQRVIVDSGATGEANFIDSAANGFTDASTSAGVTSFIKVISGVSAANPCVVTTSTDHGYQTNQQVKITDLGDVGVTNRGMEELDGKTFGITVINNTTFSLYDVSTGDAIDSTSYTAYVSGGSVIMISRVISLNNPQQTPYLVTPYVPTPLTYNAPTYALTAGTSVMGADGDVFLIEVYKWGAVYDLGDLIT